MKAVSHRARNVLIKMIFHHYVIWATFLQENASREDGVKIKLVMEAFPKFLIKFSASVISLASCQNKRFFKPT